MNNLPGKAFAIVILFIGLVFANWLYVIWSKQLLADQQIAWFLLVPLMSYFYFTFTIISLLGLLYKKQFGINIAYGVLMAGATSAAISCNFAYKNTLTVYLFVILMTFDIVGLLFMAFNRDYFQAD